MDGHKAPVIEDHVVLNGVRFSPGDAVGAIGKNGKLYAGIIAHIHHSALGDPDATLMIKDFPNGISVLVTLVGAKKV